MMGPVQSAEDLRQRGLAALNAKRLATAGRLFARALERAEDVETRSRIEVSLAYLQADGGDADAAIALLGDVVTRPGVSAEARGLAQGQRALLLMRGGRTADALQAFGEAVAALQDVPADLGKAHLNRGGVYLQQVRLAEAEADFAAADHQLRLAELPVEAAMSRHNRGYVHYLAGRLVDALHDMDDAALVLAPLSPVSRAICEQDRAEVLLAAGLATEGREALRSSARAYGARRLHQRRAEAELVLARSLVIGDPAAALVAARAARDRFGRVGADAWRARAEAVALAAEVELGRRGPGLVERADRLAAELAAQGLSGYAAQLRLHAARVLIRRGELEEAADRLAAAGVRRDAALAVRLLQRTARVELARARGRRLAALSQVRAGLEEFHAWQSTFGSLDLQTFVVGRARHLAASALELAAETGRPDVGYEWSERARMLATRVRPVRPEGDADLTADLAELRRLATGSDAVARPPRREAELRRRVRERAWRTGGSGEVADPAPLLDVRAELGADVGLVAWLVAGDDLVALTVTDAGDRLRRLGDYRTVEQALRELQPDLEMAGGTLPPAFAGPVRSGLVARLAELGDVLVAPVLDDLGDRALVATPSGGLAGVPWTLLPGLVGRPVTVTPSATWWRDHRGSGPLRSAGFVAGPRLEHAVEEVAVAARSWPGATVLTGPAATEAAVTDLAGRVDVLHVAAHGRHAADNPLFSGLELVDGPWYGYDIDRLERVPRLVVLSSCELGRSSVRFGEELIGMTAAWLHAGAEAVIASPVDVNDEVARDVLGAVHERVAAGDSPASALADVVRPASAERPPAPFVCFGAGL